MVRSVVQIQKNNAAVMALSRRAFSVSSAEHMEKQVQNENSSNSFRHEDLEISRSSSQSTMPPLEDIQFGKCFSDHQFSVEYNQDLGGWGTPKIGSFCNLSLHPAAPVLHYGMSCFEGMKAFCGKDGNLRLFRPMMNMERLARSMARIELPAFDTEELLKCISELLLVDRRWVPKEKGYSLYIRPFAMGTTHSLGVAPSRDAEIRVITGPVGPYYPSGLVPIEIFLDESNVRAWPGGTGEFKIGGNYAPTIGPQVQAKAKHNCHQVLYTIPEGEDLFVSECGAMNMFFFLKGKGGAKELVTQPLDGTILPGVTRDSVLGLCRQWGDFEVSERKLSVRELADAAREGNLLEVFGSGTACLIQPVTALVQASGERIRSAQDLNDPSALCQRLFRAITDIQYGETESEWSVLLQ